MRYIGLSLILSMTTTFSLYAVSLLDCLKLTGDERTECMQEMKDESRQKLRERIRARIQERAMPTEQSEKPAEQSEETETQP